jgi:uncharacterized protein
VRVALLQEEVQTQPVTGRPEDARDRALAAPAAAQDAGPAQGAPAQQASAPIEPERLALAREYVRESHIDAVMRAAFANLGKQMPQLAAENAADARARQFMSSFSAGMDAATPMLVDMMIETTARVFTVQELKDLVAFYGSPTGQAMVAKMPTMMQQITPMIFQMMPKVYTVAEADFCQHETCTDADHAIFQRLEASLRARLGQPNVRPQ